MTTSTSAPLAPAGDPAGHPHAPAAWTNADALAALQADEAPIALDGYRVEDWVAVTLFWLLGLTVFLQFFTRYVMNDSAAWTEEIARYLLIACVFIGAAIGVRRNNHVQVDILYRLLPAPLMRPVSVAVDLIRVAFFLACAVLSWQLLDRIGSSRMAVIDLPMGWVYGSVLLGFILMTWRAAQVAWLNWKRGASVLERPELAEGDASAGAQP